MSHTHDDFEKLVGGIFSPEEEQELSSQLQGPFYELLYPGRQELLEHFDALIERLVCTDLPSKRDEALAKFFTSMALIQELEPEMAMALFNPASFIRTSDANETGLGLFDKDTKVTGNYQGLALGPWLDIPRGEDLPDDEEPYLRKYGLLVCLKNVQVITPEAEGEIDGLVRIPLNHGEPELFRVHCA